MEVSATIKILAEPKTTVYTAANKILTITHKAKKVLRTDIYPWMCDVMKKGPHPELIIK